MSLGKYKQNVLMNECIFFYLRVNKQHIKVTQAPGGTWRDSTGRPHPEVQPPFLFIYHSDRKGSPFVYVLLTNDTLFHIATIPDETT